MLNRLKIPLLSSINQKVSKYLLKYLIPNIIPIPKGIGILYIGKNTDTFSKMRCVF